MPELTASRTAARFWCTQPPLRWGNPQRGNYTAQQDFPPPVPGAAPVSFKRGWTSIDGKFGGVRFHFANTHLETEDSPPSRRPRPRSSWPAGQGRGADIAVGDFNSAADGSTTTSYAQLTATFTDTWSIHPYYPGFTCCQNETLTNSASQLGSRIDLVLSRQGPRSRRDGGRRAPFSPRLRFAVRPRRRRRPTAPVEHTPAFIRSAPAAAAMGKFLTVLSGRNFPVAFRLRTRRAGNPRASLASGFRISVHYPQHPDHLRVGHHVVAETLVVRLVLAQRNTTPRSIQPVTSIACVDSGEAQHEHPLGLVRLQPLVALLIGWGSRPKLHASAIASSVAWPTARWSAWLSIPGPNVSRWLPVTTVSGLCRRMARARSRRSPTEYSTTPSG